MKKRLVISDETTLAYVDYGAGKPVIFIPGWTYTAKVFARNLPAFAGRYRVLAYDPRSHGDSSVTSGGNNYDQHGEDLHEFITRLGIDDCLIAGWSMGVTTAYSYFEKHGTDKASGFISIDEPPKIRKENGSDWGEGEEDELRAGLEMLTKLGHLKFFENYLYHCYAEKPASDFVRDMLSEAARTPEAVACELIRTSFDLDYREVARRIDKEIPVMQVVREDWRSAAGQWISENQPNARIYYMPAHLSFHEFAEDFNAHVLEFCDGCYQGNRGRTPA